MAQRQAFGAQHLAQHQAGHQGADLAQAQHHDGVVHRFGVARQGVGRRIDDPQHRRRHRDVGRYQHADAAQVGLVARDLFLQRQHQFRARGNADVARQAVGVLARGKVRDGAGVGGGGHAAATRSGRPVRMPRLRRGVAKDW